jgi:hypothetical protein
LALAVEKKVFLAVVELLGTLGAEMLDSLGQNQWWNDMKTKLKSTETTTKHHMERGLLEMAVEKIRVRVVAPLWHLINLHHQSEALPRLNKPKELEEMLRQSSL